MNMTALCVNLLEFLGKSKTKDNSPNTLSYPDKTLQSY